MKFTGVFASNLVRADLERGELHAKDTARGLCDVRGDASTGGRSNLHLGIRRGRTPRINLKPGHRVNQGPLQAVSTDSNLTGIVDSDLERRTRHNLAHKFDLERKKEKLTQKVHHIIENQKDIIQRENVSLFLPKSHVVPAPVG